MRLIHQRHVPSERLLLHDNHHLGHHGDDCHQEGAMEQDRETPPCYDLPARVFRSQRTVHLTASHID